MARRDGSIRLHPEYGVNPTLAVCGWCGKDTGDVVLLGAAYKGEAPMRMQVNDVPCEVCREKMVQGITFVEFVREGSSERTGRWAVLTEESVRRILNPGEFLNSVLKARAAKVTPGVADKLGIFGEVTSEGDK